MPEKSRVDGDSPDPTMETNMVGQHGWAKGPHGGAKPPQKASDKKNFGEA